MTITRNLRLDTWDEGSTQPFLVFNELLTASDALMQCCVEAITASPPGTPDLGKAWIVDLSATGDWAGHDTDIAVAVEGGWVFYAVDEGWEAYVRSVPGKYRFVSGVWAPSSGAGTSMPVALQAAVSDEITTLTTGAAKLTFRLPYAFTLTSVRASLSAASSSGTVNVDVNLNGSSVFSTGLTVDATEKTSTTAAIPAVLGTTSMSDDGEITVDIDSAGTGAKGLKVTLLGTKAL